MLKGLRNMFCGLAFGLTLIIPGVSAATIAIVMGFYDELLTTVNHFTKDLRKGLKFLLPFMLGIAVGLVMFSSIIATLLTNFSFPTMMFFIGLLAGIIPFVFSKARARGHLSAAAQADGDVQAGGDVPTGGAAHVGARFRMLKPWELVLIIAPIAALIAISNLRTATVVDPAEAISNMDAAFMAYIFLTGVIAAATLVVPGMSGSFVLLLMGIYHVIIYSVSSVRDLLADITNIPLILDILRVMAPFGVGVIIGGLAMARLIEKLLRGYEKAIYLVILGLLLGSLYALFNEPIVFQSGMTVAFGVAGAATCLMGGTASYFMSRKRS